MELRPVSRHDFTRFLRALGVNLDVSKLQSDGVTIAAQADGCYFVAPGVFDLAVNRTPAKRGLTGHRSMAAPVEQLRRTRAARLPRFL